MPKPRRADRHDLPPVRHRFHVPGKPVGYVTHGARQSWRRKLAYYDYKKRVQWEAKFHAVPLPLTASEERPVFIVTRLLCKNRVHADPENVHKGIVDALFYEADKKAKGTKDKHVGGRFDPAIYGKREGVDVEIRW